MAKFMGTPRIDLQGMNLINWATDLAETIRQRTPHNMSVIFLERAVAALAGWVPGNWYEIVGSEHEPIYVTGVHIDLYRQRWWFTYTTWSGLLDPNRTDWEGQFEYYPAKVRVQRVSLRKLYDKHDMCVTHKVIHLVMQNPADEYVCFTHRQAEIAEQELLEFEASMC